MGLSSMTGFARVDGDADGVRWTWELRSVNGKGLDIRFRVPQGFERLEPDARERCARRLTRGNVQVALSIDTRAAGQRLTINQPALDAIVDAMQQVADRIDAQPPTLDGILALRGVLEVADITADTAVRDELDDALLAGLETGVDALASMRGGEGEAIGTVLAARLDELATLTERAENSPARAPETIRARLAEQIAALLDATPALDPDRLHQEAVLLATKADIREELDRLHAHVAASRDLLEEGGPIGRRLDFLAQEFNREVNTLCAKSNDRDLTAIGLDMKAVVDQLREQVQNLE
ncbi:YicC/YloC family endoribonuclease [Bauldia sp.]|uniref:YicC/YloC family endoribonuclease n=1 Tax=Bauldia sp. TaxID=2575872 RepID=UPI003BAA8038